MASRAKSIDTGQALKALALIRASHQRPSSGGASRGGGPGKSVGVPGRSNASYLRAFDKAQKRSAKAKKKSKGDSSSVLGDVGDFGANLVESGLNLADVPRSYVASHVADIAGAAESGDLGKTINAVGNTINPANAISTTAAGAADAFGIAPHTAETVARHGYTDPAHARDFLEHTGVGTYLQRAIDRHPKDLGFLNKALEAHVPGTPLDVGISGKDVIGFGGDVGLDPLTYVTGGASDVAKAGGKGVARAIVEAGDKAAAEAVAKAGVDAAKAGVPEAVRLQAKNAIETGVKHEFDKALKEATTKGHGLRNITNKDVYKAVTGNTGGVRVRVPGTGRYGRQVQRLAGAENPTETLAPLVSKELTDKLNPVLDKIKGTAQTAGEKTFGRVARKGELAKALRDPNSSPDLIRKLLAAESADVVANARREASLRFVRRESDAALREDMKHPGLHPLQAANEAVASKLGPDALHEYQKIRKLIKQEGADKVVHLIESGRAGESRAATALSDWFDRFHETANANGVDLARRENYVPRALSENAKKLVLGDQTRAGLLKKGSFEYSREEENAIRKAMAAEAKRSGLDLKPESFTSAETRAYGEKLAQLHYGDKLKGSYYEGNIDKLVLNNANALKERLYQVEKQRRLLDENVLQEVPGHGVTTDPGAIKATEHKVKALDKEIAKIQKRLAKNRDASVGVANDQAQSVQDALAQVPTKESALVGAEGSPQGSLDLGTTILDPRTPAAKDQAYQRTLDLGWQSVAEPTTPQSIQQDLAAATNMAQEEVARGVTDGFQTQRARALQAAADVQDAATQKAVKIQADALNMQDQLSQLYKTRNVESRALERLKAPQHMEQVRQQFMQGKELLAANPELAGDRDVAEILNRMDDISGSPEHFKKFIAGYDKVLNFVKKWQLATPGFHLRNFMGGMYNNYLAGVEFGSHIRFLSDLRKYKNGSLDATRSGYMEDLLSHLNTGQYSAVETGAGKRFGRHLTPVGAYLDANREAGAHVEQLLRGALGYDRLLKGKGIDQALSDIVRFHFDYQDLSSFERKYVKRIVPFYSWTRNNVPLQVEMYLQAPQKYARYIQAQNEIQAPVDKGTVVPSYYGSMFGIPTSAHEGGPNGGQVFLTPDLPMTQTLANAVPNLNAFDTKDPVGSTLSGVAEPLLGNVTPLIKTPYEVARGEQVFKGIPLRGEPYMKKGKLEPNPTWANAPGVLQALRAVGLAVDTKQGLRVTDTGQYVAEQYLPALSRIRKLDPQAKKDVARQGANVASFLGLPIRTNTQFDQAQERYSRKLAKAAANKKPRY